MLKIILCGFTQSVFSGRKIESLLKDSIRMMWLAQGYEPSYRTINRFRIHPEMKELLRQCFVQFRNQLVKEEIIYPIYTNIEDAKHANSCKPFIRSFLDIDEDDKYEVIVSCAKYSIQKPEDMLYQLTDEGMKLLISNQ